MKVDRARFLDQGYLIVRGAVPSAELDGLRKSYETLVDRQRAIWAAQRKEGDPPGGLWETAKQPRVSPASPGLLDRDTANAVDVWLGENILGVAEQLLGQQASVSMMTTMCNPTWDYGPDEWHRDIHPIDMGPLAYLQRDVQENGARWVQWNIPLYDDDVLWVVPTSHRRLNTEAEDSTLLEHPRTPLPGAVQVELSAGEAVVYVNHILHWGSEYTPKLRRTLHGGHSVSPFYLDLTFAEHLSDAAREQFMTWDRKSADLQDRTEATYRAAIAGDSDGFVKGVESLHPGGGPNAKALIAIFLCKGAQQIKINKNRPSDLDSLSDEDQEIHRRALMEHHATINWGPQFADRFTRDEAEALWERFEPLDAILKSDVEQFSPGFQSAKMHYYFNTTPQEITLETVIESWRN